MPDRIVKMDAPEGMRQVGWHCTYHEGDLHGCFNPLDCDLLPVWTLDYEQGIEALKHSRAEMRNE